LASWLYAYVEREAPESTPSARIDALPRFVASTAHGARSIPQARLVLLPEVSHFAPLQRPEVFNNAVLAFLASGTPASAAAADGPPSKPSAGELN
jgi:hypothetical protein